MLKKIAAGLVVLGALGAGVWWVYGSNAPAVSNPIESAATDAKETVFLTPKATALSEPKPQQAFPQPKSVSGWEIKTLDTKVEQFLRKEFRIDRGEIKQLQFNPELLNQLNVGDEFQIATPESTELKTITITQQEVNDGIKSMSGTIQGLGLGQGVMLTHKGGVLAGNIITERNSWSIDTAQGVTFITNGRRSLGLEVGSRDDSVTQLNSH